MALAFAILVIVAAVIGGVIALLVTGKLPDFGDHGLRKKSDDDNRDRGGVEHRLEAGEIKFEIDVFRHLSLEDIGTKR